MKTYLFLAFFSFSFQGFSQTGENDPSFNPIDDGYYGDNSGFNNTVRTINTQADGKIIVGGTFTSVNGATSNYIARILPDGSLDPTFVTGSGFNTFVYSTVIQSDGKIIVGGNFTSYDGTMINRIARLNTDGSLDNTFNIGTGFSAEVFSMSIQNDGKIIVAGDYTFFNGDNLNRIVRLNPDGSLDPTFVTGNGIYGDVNSVSVQSDGKIIAGGYFSPVSGSSSYSIVRLNDNGSLDPTFNTGEGFNSMVTTTIVQSDGKIIVGGYFDTLNNTASKYIVRLNSNGSIDPTFNTGSGFNNIVSTISIQNDSKVIVGGSFTSYNGTTRNRIIRLNPDGSLDNSYNLGSAFNSNVYASCVQNDNKVLVGGNYITFNGTTVNRLARLNEDGSLDFNFNSGTGFNSYVRSTCVQTDGKIIVGGWFTAFNGAPRNYIARLTVDGLLDTTFSVGNGFNGFVRNVYLQNDGKIIAVGEFTSYNGTNRKYIARLNSDGSLDNTFSVGTGFNSNTNCATIQSDGKIIVGGMFTSFNGTPLNYIARLNANGSLDNTFNIGTGFSHYVYNTAVHSNGKIVVVGNFNWFNGSFRSYLAQLNSDGSIDNSFNVGNGFNGNSQTISIQNDEKIIVGGSFSEYNGTNRNGIIRLNTDGSSDPTFNPGTGFNGPVIITHLQSDGKIIVGGNFPSFNGIARRSIARINTNGSLDITFDPGSGTEVVNAMVHAISSQSIDRVIIGGSFTSYDSTHRNYIARLKTCSPISFTENITTCGSYTWRDGNTYTTSALGIMYTEENATSSGCDSIYTLNLNMQYFSGIDTQTACDSFTWMDGNTYTQSNNFATYTLQNSIGCDSIVTLHLTIIDSQPVNISMNGNGQLVSTFANDYQWINCITQQPILGENENVFSPSINGTYAVVSHTNNMCPDTSNCIVVNNVGINDINSLHLEVFPNPTTNNIELRFQGDELELVLCDIQGKLLCSRKIHNAESISLADYPNGVYFLNLQSNEVKIIRKVIKQ